MTSSPTAQAAGSKRVRESDDAHSPTSPSQRASTNTGATGANTSNFRNVSACHRCRLRKNRCDQRLPACTACEKVNHRCVGFDPITKQEIPRSYVYYLESRVAYCESLLAAHDIKFEPADAFEDGTVRGQGVVHSPRVIQPSRSSKETVKTSLQRHDKQDAGEKTEENERLNKMVDDIGLVTVQGASDRRYLGSTSGISFARVVLAAVKSSVAANSSERGGAKSGSTTNAAAASGGSSMRDSYFGLSTKPTIKEAPFPDRELGERLVHLYFEHANPQIPILHREDFLLTFDHAYSVEPRDRTPRALYLLNIVFAIGAGVIFGSSDHGSSEMEHSSAASKRLRLSGTQQAQPEEYHASAIVHLSSFLSASSMSDGQEKSGGDLDDLQAVLLLAGFALLRPVAPGLWYIVGVAMRLAVDLGLHFEDGLGLDSATSRTKNSGHTRTASQMARNPEERGKREWTRDLRRRLWWCTYCFDRLVSTCVGRPFGITDVVVTTEFPSALDDMYITRAGLKQPRSANEPSYKLVTHHYLRLRLLQSEILQVLQYQQAQNARHRGVNSENQFVHKNAPSPFLIKHPDFRSWRSDIDQRLWEWKESAPSSTQTGVAFSVQFLELNYWQAVIMLYRNSLSVPDQLANETSPTEEVSTPTSPPADMDEDQDIVFLKCAEAGQKTLKLYRQLHRRRLVNYTYLATHHLFMAGISFLYAVWHSPVVRSRLSLDDFDFTVLAATSVLGDLMEKCPPAEACRDAFERMSKATVQMCMSTPEFGFGSSEQNTPFPVRQTSPTSVPMSIDHHMKRQDTFLPIQESTSRSQPRKRPPPKFDMDLRDLFPEDLDNSIRPSKSIPQQSSTARTNTVQNHGSRGRDIVSRQQQQRQQLQQKRHHHTNMIEPTGPRNARESSFTSNMQPRQSSQILPSQSSRATTATGHNQNNQTLPTTPPPQHRSPSSYMDVNQNSYNPDFMSNLPGLEFLNSITSTGNSSTTIGVSNHDNRTAAPTSTTSTSPYQFQSPNHQPHLPRTNSMTGSTTDSMDAISADMSMDYTQNMYDFGGGGDGGGGMDDMTPYLDDGSTSTGTTGNVLGFDFAGNLGFEFGQQHDWGNGSNGFDLFGGFFFDRNGGG